MKYKLILAIFILAFISSFFVLQGFSCTDSCSIVENSQYGSIFGIQNGYIGMIIFGILILITILHILKPTKSKRQIIHTGIIIGSIIAVYFLYLQQFVIETYCKYCLITDFAILIGFIIILFNWKK